MNFLSDPFKLIKPRYDDSGVDRLNYYYTPVVIILMAVTLTAKQYVGEPLQCWVPAQFNKAWEQYAENYCFVYNTYWVRPGEEVPSEIGDRLAAQLIYYQWVPFIMVIEAGLFHFPSKIWAVLAKTNGLNLAGMVHAVVKAEENSDERKLQQAVLNVCTLLENSNRMRMMRTQGASRMGRYTRLGELSGTYLSNVYLIAKLIYCLNTIVQFTSLNKFLKQPDIFWGASVLSDIVNGHNWEDSGNFPRIAMCDFEVRTMGNIQRYSIQCVLIVNMFNEKVFLFLYWWIILVGILTVIDSVAHLISMKLPSRRQRFVKRFIMCPPEERAVLEDFTKDYLNPDMFLILKIIDGHTSEIVTVAILQQLYDNFRINEETEAEEATKEASADHTLLSLRAVQIPSPTALLTEEFDFRRFSRRPSPITR